MVDLTSWTRYFNHINYKCKCKNQLPWHCQPYALYVYAECVVWALRQCMFYIQHLYGDRHMRVKKKKNATVHAHTPPFKRPLQRYMLLHPIPAFCVLQCVIYGAVSMSKQAKANSPGESLQMHTASSPQCHTHSSASQHCTKLKPPKLSSFPRSTAAHGRQLLIWKCYGNKT